MLCRAPPVFPPVLSLCGSQGHLRAAGSEGHDLAPKIADLVPGSWRGGVWAAPPSQTPASPAGGDAAAPARVSAAGPSTRVLGECSPARPRDNLAGEARAGAPAGRTPEA